jgi:hypothetical protein
VIFLVSGARYLTVVKPEAEWENFGTVAILFPKKIPSQNLLAWSRMFWKCGTVQIFGNDYKKSNPDSGGN